MSSTRAALLIKFLDCNQLLRTEQSSFRISNNALAAIARMMAMSSPDEEDLIVALIQRLISDAN